MSQFFTFEDLQAHCPPDLYPELAQRLMADRTRKARQMDSSMITWGKYKKEMTILECYEKDPSYLKWCLKQDWFKDFDCYDEVLNLFD